MKRDKAKERYFSPRSRDGQWDPKDQPPEFWNQFLTEFPPETHVRVHPLLHWSELNIWEYIEREKIPMVPLYFARQYPEYENQWMRFRSIGEKGITFPIKSRASNLNQIIEELKVTKVSERSKAVPWGRMKMNHPLRDSGPMVIYREIK